MRNRVMVPLLMMLIMTIPTSIGAGEGGVDTNPDEDDPFYRGFKRHSISRQGSVVPIHRDE